VKHAAGLGFAGALVALIAVSALAQTAPPDGTPTRIRGTVEKLDGQTLQVKSRDGQSLVITLAPNVTIAAVVRRGRGRHQGRRLRRLDLGERHRRGTARDRGPHLPRSHARHGGGPVPLGPRARQPDDQRRRRRHHRLKVTYKGSDAEIMGSPDIPIVTYVPGDTSLLKPGAAIFSIALKKADGSLTAGRVTVEKDGVKPPM
jgi:hypothetical protein